MTRTIVIYLLVVCLLLPSCDPVVDLVSPPWITPPTPEGWTTLRPPHDVHTLALQGDILWGGGVEGIFRVDLRIGDLLPLPEGTPPFSLVRAILVEGETVWVGHRDGLAYYDYQTGWDNVPIGLDGIPDPHVNALFLDSQGRLWVGTWGGVALRTPQGWQTLTSVDGLLHDMVNVILEDDSGGMWFGSYVSPKGGLSRLQDGHWMWITTQDGLPHANIAGILQASDGRIWAATGLVDRGGAAALALDAEGVWRVVEVLHKSDGLAGEKARSLFEDSRSVLWVGSEYEGLALRLPDCWLRLNVEEGLVHPEIKVMLPDPQGGLWIGTRDGLNHLNSAAIQALVCPE